MASIDAAPSDGPDPEIDVSSDAIAQARAECDAILASPAVVAGAKIGEAVNAIADLAYLVRQAEHGTVQVSVLVSSARSIAVTIAATLVAEQRRHERVPPPRILRQIKTHVHRELGDTPPFSDAEGAALFLYEQSVKLRIARRESSNAMLLTVLAFSLSAACRIPGLFGTDPGSLISADVHDAAATDAHVLLGEDRTEIEATMRKLADAVRDGETFDEGLLYDALSWNDRLAATYLGEGGDPQTPASIAALDALLASREVQVDPRRAWLADLAGVQSRAASEPEGLSKLREMATDAIATLDEDGAQEFEALASVHELISSGGDTAVVSEHLPIALTSGLPAGLLVPPTVAELEFTDTEKPDASTSQPQAAIEPEAPVTTAPTPNEPSAAASADEAEAEEQGEPQTQPSDATSKPTSRPIVATPVAEAKPHPAAAPSVAPVPVPVPDNATAQSVITANVAVDGSVGVGVDADQVVAEALVAGRFSIAYWATVAAREDLERFTVDALRVAALAAGVGDESTDIADELDLALQQTISTEDPNAAELLYAAAAMRLLLVKPFGVAPAVLREAARDIQHLCPPYASACTFIADRSSSGLLVDLRASESARHSAQLQERRTALRQRAVEGRERWPLETQKYPPANRIWSRWTTGSGELRKLLDLLAEGSPDAKTITALVDNFVVRKSLDRRIDDAYNQARPRKGDKLEATARSWLYSRVDRILGLASEWLELLREVGSSQAVDQPDGMALRNEFVPIDRAVCESFDELEQSSPSLGAAVGFARIMWGFMRAHVLMEDRPAQVPLSVDGALNGDLAAAPEMMLDEAGRPERSPDNQALPVLREVLHRQWLEAFEERFAQGDHGSTQIALEHLEPGPATDALARRRDDDLYARRERLRARVDQLQVRLSRLLACGAFTASDFERAKAPLDQLVVAEVTRFPVVDARLNKLDEELAQHSAQHRSALEARLQTVSADRASVARLTELLDDEQYDVADELIGQLARGEPLTSTETDEDLLVEFLASLKGLSDANSAVARLAASEAADSVEVDAAKEAIKQLATLRGANLSTNVLRQRIRLIFTMLGLDVVGGSVRARRGLPQVGEIEMDASPFGASWLPPELGSGVGLDVEQSRPGHYTLLVVRTPMKETELVSVVRSHTDKGRAVLVLAVEPLPLQRRLALARSAREARVTFLLADAFSLMFQAMPHRHPGGRFDLWLASSLPFSWVNPYVTQGNVPPEMFVGRREELQTLQDAAGSCFVFGGRQLGKSVLLRAVRSTAHAPQRGRVGILIDLKMEGIGSRRPVDELWAAIASHLDEADVGSSKGPTDRAAVVSRIRAWLEEDHTRQIKLLLDETDAFLEEEARSRHFENVLALRNLMEETERRFKVVLAGLHSVNRFRRIPNQPLAQFGGSAPIGPLSWSDARYLVEVPMRAAGFRLDPPDLVHRVLVESRRHPSILQFVCRALIDHFSGAAGQRGEGLPISISAAELDQVFEQEDLRERIRERFEWTLNLDPRYRVIALIMAFRSVEEPSVATEGLLPRELWDQAMAYWEPGFSDLSRDEFDVLLEEMVNLEVLAQTNGRYRMPSARVLRLLGDETKILEALEQETERDPQEAPSPERLRRALGAPQGLERSPLTRGDERQLLDLSGPSVRVVFGTGATNVHRVFDGLLEAASERVPSVPIYKAKAAIDFEYLAKTRSAKTDGSILMGSWTPPSAEGAAESLRQYLAALADRGDNGQIVIAVVDHRSMQVWSDLYEMLELYFAGEVRWIALKRWDTEQVDAWLEELAVPHDQRTLGGLIKATGGWPALLTNAVTEARDRDRGLEEAAGDVSTDLDSLQALVTGLQLHDSHEDKRLKAFCDYNDALDASELATLTEDGDVDGAQRLLDVLWLSQAATRTGDRLVKLESTVARALEAEAIAP